MMTLLKLLQVQMPVYNSAQRINSLISGLETCLLRNNCESEWIFADMNDEIAIENIDILRA